MCPACADHLPGSVGRIIRFAEHAQAIGDRVLPMVASCGVFFQLDDDQAVRTDFIGLITVALVKEVNLQWGSLRINILPGFRGFIILWYLFVIKAPGSSNASDYNDKTKTPVRVCVNFMVFYLAINRDNQFYNFKYF